MKGMRVVFNKKRIVVPALAALLFVSLSVNVLGAGAGSLTEIKVFLNTGIKVMLHGKAFEPVETDGKTKIVPITYRGTTYLPMRAVAEATGLKVTWDGKTETAYLGEVAGDIAKDSISYIKASPEFVYNGSRIYRLATRTPDELKTDDGTELSFGYVTGGSRSIILEITTDFAYSKFKAKIWASDTKTTDDLDVTLTDENNILVKKLKVKQGKTTDLEFDIKDTKKLWVNVQGDRSIIGEPMLGK